MVGYGTHYGYGNRYGYPRSRRRFDVRAKVGSIAMPASGGNITLTGFDFNPELLLPVSAGMGGTGTQAIGTLGVGAITKEGQYGSCSVSSQSGVTPTVTARRKDPTAISWLSSGGGIGFSFTASAWSQSGIQLDFATSLGGRDLSYAALGGTIKKSLTEQTMNVTGLTESFAHGLGETPSAIHIIAVVGTLAGAQTSSTAYLSRGWWANAKQWAQSTHMNNGTPTSVTRRCQSADKVWLYHATSGLLRSMKIESVDSTHVHVSYPNTTSTTAFKFFMLALGGCRADCGVWDGNLTIAPVELPVACDPKFAEFTSMRLGVDNDNSVLTVAFQNVAYTDGSTVRTNGFAETNGASPTAPWRHQDNSFRAYNTTPSLRTAGGLILSPGKLTYDVTDLSAGDPFDQGTYLTLGN